jgi:hypothetical protein
MADYTKPGDNGKPKPPGVDREVKRSSPLTDVLACDTLYGVKFTVETTDILFFLRRWLRQFFSWLFAKAAARYDYRDLYQAASFMALRRLGSIVCNTDCPVVHKALVDRGVGRRGITFFAFVVYAVYCRPGVGGFNPQLTPVEDLTDDQLQGKALEDLTDAPPKFDHLEDIVERDGPDDIFGMSLTCNQKKSYVISDYSPKPAQPSDFEPFIDTAKYLALAYSDAITCALPCKKKLTFERVEWSYVNQKVRLRFWFVVSCE